MTDHETKISETIEPERTEISFLAAKVLMELAHCSEPPIKVAARVIRESSTTDKLFYSGTNKPTFSGVISVLEEAMIIHNKEGK